VAVPALTSAEQRDLSGDAQAAAAETSKLVQLMIAAIKAKQVTGAQLAATAAAAGGVITSVALVAEAPQVQGWGQAVCGYLGWCKPKAAAAAK
jgi:hypothetical protein